MKLFRRHDPFDALVDELCREIEATMPDVSIERHGDSLALSAQDTGPPAMLYPRNFADGLDSLAPDERRTAVRRIVRSLSAGQPEGDLEELTPRLFPAVRAWSWTAAAVGATVSRPIAPFVEAAVAVDDQVTMSFVTAGDLDAWRTDWDEVWHRAVQNFATAPLGLDRVDGYTGVGAVRGPEAYVSSALICPDRLRELGRELPGSADRVVMAPTRDEVYLATVDDLDGLEALAALGEQRLREDPRAISPVLYRLGGQGLVPWEPGPEHPMASAVARSWALLAGAEYGAQQARLDELFEEQGSAAYVATLMLFQPSDGAPVATGTTWSEGVTEALIPRADYVTFLFDDGSDILVRWSDVLQIAGDWLIRDDSFGLARWRYSALPDEPHLDALRQRALPAA